jgi:hypothetical protein
MTQPIVHARGGHVTLLNPAWDFVNRGKDDETVEDGLLIESWPVENQNDINSYGIQPFGTTRGGYQAFTAVTSGKAKSAKVSLRNELSNNVGNIVVSLHAMASSFPGAGPVFPPLAISDPVDVTTISTAANGALHKFTFSGANQIDLIAGNNYAISVTKDDRGAFEGEVSIGYKFGGPASGHAGNGGYVTVTSWGPDSLCDMIFYLYGDAIVPPPPPVLIYSHAVELQDDKGFSYGIMGAADANDPFAMSSSFQALILQGGGKLSSVKLWVRAQTGNFDVLVNVYNATSTGSAMTPTGPILATSETIPNASLDRVDGSLQEFLFTGANQIDLQGGQSYAFVFTNAGAFPPTGEWIYFGCHWASTPPNNGGFHQGGWQVDDGCTFTFYLYATT